MASMGPRAVGLALLLAGCGRLAFESHSQDDAVVSPPIRKTLHLDRVGPAEPLDNFPLPVTLAGADASTLRVFSSNGTELAHEIESAGPPVVAWVLVPHIEGTTTQLTVEYGGAPSSQSRVFGADYAGVWHMNGAGALADASPFDRDAETTGTTSIPGVVGEAREYVDGDCAVVRGMQSVALPLPVTMTAWMWIRAPHTGGDFDAAFTKQDVAGEDQYFLGLIDDQYLGAILSNPLGTPALFAPIQEIAAWHRLTYTYDGALSVMYVDEVPVSNGPAGGATFAGPNPMFIGCGRNTDVGPNDQPDTDWTDGRLDEVRIEAVARSPAWLAFEHAAHRDQVITYE
jgi:hypothetical protein